MREPRRLDQGNAYERPNQDWVCGLAEEGPACLLGPTAKGHCPQSAACHPVKDGDRWQCNRSPLQGGECAAGPSPEGECCLRYTCAPVRSLRARRGRFVKGCVLASLGALCLLLSSRWRNELIAPGPLSVHHAQLLARGETRTNRCGACHAAGNQSVGQWLSHLTDSAVANPTQSSLCLECHQQKLAPASALWAHNVDPQVLLEPLAEKATSPVHRRRDPTEPLACSVCHQEHHGSTHDLAAISDRACQACHREEFHSFATDHPEFDGWPEGRRTRIAFDHAQHQSKHFPKEKQTFACGDCHQQDGQSGFQLTQSYEATCARMSRQQAAD